MNILLRELRANVKGLVIWCVCIAALVFLAGVEFDAFREEANVNQMIESLPEGMRKALSLDVIRFDRPEGFFSYVGQYLMVMAVIYAALAGVKILSREISKKTAETMFTLPVTRRRIVSMKLIAALVRCVVLTAVTCLATFAVFANSNPGPEFYGKVLLFGCFLLLMQVLFVLAGLFVSVLSKRHKRTGTLIASITVVAYMLTFIVRLGEKTEFVKYITPFEYFPPVAVMHGHELELFGFVAVPALIVALFSLSFVLARKKDIY